MGPARFARRVAWFAWKHLAVRFGIDPVTRMRVSSMPGMVELGRLDGRWTVPGTWVDSASICYCVGCGENISFDLELVDRFGCQVWAFDPTPRAIAYVRSVAGANPAYHFSPIGLWSKKERLKFYTPSDESHVSHSILNLQHTEKFFEADVERLGEIMRRHGHGGLTLLKLDIEGAEYEVLKSMMDDGISPAILCVEFDEFFNPLDPDFRRRIRASLAQLVDYGYRIAFTSGNANYTLVHNSAQRSNR